MSATVVGTTPTLKRSLHHFYRHDHAPVGLREGAGSRSALDRSYVASSYAH